MSSHKHQNEEEHIQKLTKNGELERAAERTLAVYGEELFGFLLVAVQDDIAVHDLFQHLSLEMWKALPRFQWRCSLRTWLYILARQALSRHKRDPNHQLQTLSTGELEALPDRLRTATQTWRKSHAKTRLRTLCEQLPAADRELLALRIDQRMTWPEIAQVLSNNPDQFDADEQRKASAKLRKRFERLKNTLRTQMNADEASSTPPHG